MAHQQRIGGARTQSSWIQVRVNSGFVLPTPKDVIFFESPAELRAWFESNHETATELWLGYHRKRTGRPSVTWQEVVDEALCFGWIDSVRYSLGDDRSAQRITPRRQGSVWSAINIRRFQELDEMRIVHPGRPHRLRETRRGALAPRFV